MLRKNIATPLSGKVYDAKNKNVYHAKSIKIGSGITLERLNGANSFSVKINGERVEFRQGDETNGEYDFEYVLVVWSAANNKYQDENSDYFYRLRNHAKTKEKKESLNGFVGGEKKKDAFESAIGKLKELGVKPDKLQGYILQKQNENY